MDDHDDKEVVEPERCTALAHKGSGSGICDTPLTRQGDCPRANFHIEA